jgi:hypothetical protein
MDNPTQSNSDIAANNQIQPTSATAPDQITPNDTGVQQIPNPIAKDTPASVGVTPPSPTATSPSATPPPSPTAKAAIQQAKQPAVPNTPADIHTSVFKNVLGILGGGANRPVIDPKTGQPQVDANGQVVMGKASVKSLGASILAGALSAMAAGMATPTTYHELGGGRTIADNSAAFGAGVNASQPMTQQGAQARAQGQADQNTARKNAATAQQYEAADHNLKLHAAMLGNLKLQGDVMKQGVQDDAPLIDAMKLNPTATGPDGKPLSMISGEHVSEKDLQKMMADGTSHVTRDSVLRDGVANVYDDQGKQVMNPDGTPRQEYTYTVYNHDAEVAMTDEMKKDNPNLQYVATGTSVPMAVLAKGTREKAETANAQGYTDQWAKQVSDFKGGKPVTVDLKAAMAKDPYLKKLIPQLGRYAGMEPDQVITQMDKDKVDPILIGKFSNLFGGIDRDKMQLQRADEVLKQKDQETEQKIKDEADQKRQTPEGQLDLRKKQLEIDALTQAAASVKASQDGIKIPDNFTPNPHAVSMDSTELSKTLTTQGVEIPANFQALYAIGHNAASLSTLSNNPRPKTGIMPRDQALSFIRTFINPQFQEGDYAANANLQKELRSTMVGKAGGTIISAGTASTHMDMLAKAADSLNNGNLTDWNNIKAQLGIKTGDPDPLVFKAITQKLNEEIEKVTSGGAPMQASLKEAADNLGVQHSPEQIKSVLKGYVGLMNGRISEIDDRSYQYTGRHIPVSANMTRVFNANGFTVPGQPAGSKPLYSGDTVIGFTSDGGKTMIPAPAPVR